MPVVERKFTVAEAQKAPRSLHVLGHRGGGAGGGDRRRQASATASPGPLTRRIHELYARKAGIES